MMKLRQKSRRDISYKKIDKNSSSEDDTEETELFVRNKTPKREIPTVEKLVEEGDTLQSLAIRYHCTIEDLKRLNNIHKENEIFAKRTIKVPHYPITEALAGVHVSGTSSPLENLPQNSIHTNSVLTNTLINLSDKEEVNEIIFNSNIIQKAPQIEPQTEPSEFVEENVHLLPQDMQQAPQPMATKLTCNPVDGDIPLGALIFCIVIVIFAVPLVYVFLIAEHAPSQHHQKL